LEKPIGRDPGKISNKGKKNRRRALEKIYLPLEAHSEAVAKGLEKKLVSGKA